MTARKGNIFIPLLTLVALITTLTAGFLFWQNQAIEFYKPQVTAPPISVTPTPTPRSETDNWNEMVFSYYDFSLKFPKNWEVSNDALTGKPIIFTSYQVITNSPQKLITIHEKGDTVNSIDFDMSKGVPKGITIHGFSPEFEKIISTFKYANQGTTKYDGCGQEIKYSTAIWFPDFSQALLKERLKTDQIADMCVALDKSKLIALMKSSYCEGPAIYMYQMSTKSLSKAKVIDHGRGCLASPTEFSLRNDYIIPMRGQLSDAGCQTDMDYLYNLENNTINLREERAYCQNEPGKTTRY